LKRVALAVVELTFSWSEDLTNRDTAIMGETSGLTMGLFVDLLYADSLTVKI
jgi:hypothetical protein